VAREPVEPHAVGLPGAGDGHVVCLLRILGGVAAGGNRRSPGGLCGDKPCWNQTPGGAAYRAGKTADGLNAISLVARNGKANIKVTGRGPALGLPESFGVVAVPLIAQLQAGDGAGGACWQDRYDTAKFTQQRITVRH